MTNSTQAAIAEYRAANTRTLNLNPDYKAKKQGSDLSQKIKKFIRNDKTMAGSALLVVGGVGQIVLSIFLILLTISLVSNIRKISDMKTINFLRCVLFFSLFLISFLITPSVFAFTIYAVLVATV